MIAEPTRSRWHDQIRALAVGSTALHAACADGRAAHWIASAVRARACEPGRPALSSRRGSQGAAPAMCFATSL